MIYYLAGPMTGIKDYNHPAFHNATKKLRQQGYDIINPAEISGPIDSTLPRSFYLKMDLQHLLKCTGIIMLPGWKASAGASLEYEIAKQLDFEIMIYEE